MRVCRWILDSWRRLLPDVAYLLVCLKRSRTHSGPAELAYPLWCVAKARKCVSHVFHHSSFGVVAPSARWNTLQHTYNFGSVCWLRFGFYRPSASESAVDDNAYFSSCIDPPRCETHSEWEMYQGPMSRRSNQQQWSSDREPAVGRG